MNSGGGLVRGEWAVLGDGERRGEEDDARELEIPFTASDSPRSGAGEYEGNRDGVIWRDKEGRSLGDLGAGTAYPMSP